jgi:hypothetical protein
MYAGTGAGVCMSEGKIGTGMLRPEQFIDQLTTATGPAGLKTE